MLETILVDIKPALKALTKDVDSEVLERADVSVSPKVLPTILPERNAKKPKKLSAGANVRL